MKKMEKCFLSIIICFCFNINSLKAQNNIVPNNSFENGNSFPSCQYAEGNSTADDFDSHISDWKVARHNIDNGFDVPEWVDITHTDCMDNYVKYFCNSSSPDYYETNRFIVLSKLATNRHGAIRVKLLQKLIAGETYIIRMKVIPLEFSSVVYNLQSHLRVHFTEKDVNWDSNNNNEKFEAIDANIISTSQYNCQWNLVERSFTVPSNLNKLENLVLYIESNSMAIDDLELFKKCPDYLFIQNKLYSGYIYHTNSLTYGNNPGIFYAEHVAKQIEVGPNVLVQNTLPGYLTTQIVYTAGEKIILKSGFKVEAGARFRAVISACPNNIYNRIGNLNIEDSSSITNETILANETVSLQQEISEITQSNTAKIVRLSTTENNQVNSFFKTGISALKIYPNPNNGLFILEMSNVPNANYTIQITDALGRSVIEQKINVQEHNLKQNINLQAHSKGIYFVKINSEQLNEVRKVVVE